MAMNNSQRLFGGVVLLGGGILLAAVLLKGQNDADKIHNAPSQTADQTAQTQQNPEQEIQQEHFDLQPLSVDVETERRLLDEQRKAREKAVAEQERLAAEYLAMQQQAEAEAARKAAEEHAALLAHRQPQMQSSDNIPPELIEDEQTKAKQDAETKRKAEQDAKAKRDAEVKRTAEQETKAKQEADLKRKAEQDAKAKQEIELKRKAEADAKAKRENEIKRKAEQDAKAKQEAKAKQDADAKRKAEEDKKKKEAEEARKLLEDGNKNWMVQVALAANQANADAVTARLQAKGYKVTQSPTSKGVRIMVGPSKDRETADAARKKITSDESLNMKGAWVIDWVPLEQR